MKIEIWSDYACPFCYIGKRHLEEALNAVPFKDEVEVHFKSFELDPHANRDTNLTIHEILAKKYGTTLERAKEMGAGVAQQAASAGLTFKFDSMIPTNSLDAHRLTKFAESKGKGPEMTERLLKAYFTDSYHIGDHATLIKLAKEIGLNEEEVKAFLKSDEFTEEVRADEEEARTIGVQGVPFFVINRKYAVSGAQPSEVFVNTMKQIWDEENTITKLQPITTNESTGMICDEDGCEIPER